MDNIQYLKILLAFLLVICLFDMPYGYYMLVRFIATFSFAYFAFLSNESNLRNQTFIFIALALLFQPFFKISLGRELWNVVDVIAAIGLIYSTFTKPKN